MLSDFKGVALVSLLHGNEPIRGDMLRIFDEHADRKIVVWTDIDQESVMDSVELLQNRGIEVYCSRISQTYGQAIIFAADLIPDDWALVYASGRRAVVHRTGWIADLLSPFRDKWCGISGCVRPCQYDRIAQYPTDIFDPQVHVQGGCFAIRASLLKECGFGKFPQVFSDIFLSHAVIRRGFYLADVLSVRCNEGEVVSGICKIAVGYPDRTNRSYAFRKDRLSSGDISDHLETLRSYAGRSSRVLEFGTRGGVSTLALLCGQPDRLTTVDIDPNLVAADRMEFLKRNAGRTLFRQEIGDSRIREPEWADLLFIDTDHNYQCLTAELDRHHSHTTRWIILHDTESFPECKRAVNDFLNREQSFVLLQHFENNNGLTILERCQ